MGTDTERPAGAPELTADVDLRARPQRTDLHDPVQRTQVEEALTTVPGVLGARLVPGYERPVDELHVLTSLDKAPKQAVRDLQTLLMARFGVATDHRVISVVQLDEASVPAGTAAQRVIIAEVALTHRGADIRSEVRLRDGEDELSGAADGPSTPMGQRTAVARATLDALSPVLGDDTRIDLEGCDVVDVLTRRVAIALIGFRSSRGQHTVTGSALVRDAEADAVARAVLDALNRTLEDAPDPR